MAHLDDAGTQRANLRFIRWSMQAPMLSREDEQALAARWRDAGDEQALHALIGAYARLVVSTAGRFRGYGLPIGDLIQEGNVGLLQAAARFEPAREVRFSTYACWWIRAAMQDYILRNWSIVRTGTTAAQKSLFFNLRRLRARIAGPAGAALSEEERKSIAETLRVPAGEVQAMEQRLQGGDRSLNAPVTEEGRDAQDYLLDGRPDPEAIVIGLRDGQTRARWLQEALGELSERERIIIAERRLRDEAVTLEALGVELGVSKERVRQLEHRALAKLKVSILQRTNQPADLLLEG